MSTLVKLEQNKTLQHLMNINVFGEVSGSMYNEYT